METTNIKVYPRDPILLVRKLSIANVGLLIVIVFVSSIIAYREFKSKRIKNQLECLAIPLTCGYIYFLFLCTVICRRTLTSFTYKLIPLWSYYDIIVNRDYDLLIENVLNVGMMAPVGAMLRVYSPYISWRHVIRFSTVCSLCIELAQLIFRRGLAEFDDIIHNSCGALIGFLIMNYIMNCITKKNRMRDNNE